jgi:hypothetical protein
LITRPAYDKLALAFYQQQKKKETLMCAEAKQKRVLRTEQHIALDQALDILTDKKYSASEFLASFKPKLEKLHALGYTTKQLANIISEKTGETFTSAEIKRALAGNTKKPKAKKMDAVQDDKQPANKPDTQPPKRNLMPEPKTKTA